MNRLKLTVVFLAFLAPGAAAEETVLRLSVAPMPAPVPAFAYALLPPLGELQPGNPAQGYIRCFMEQRLFFFSQQSAGDRTRYQALPLAELPAGLSDYGSGILRHADWSARLEPLDWQSLPQLHQSDTPALLSPELGPLQILAEALNARFRGAIAERKYPVALRTAQTMFMLGRHLGEHPARSANLVGLSIAHLALGTLTELVQQPGSPNLYWALADLPTPLVDLRRGVQADGIRMAAELRAIRDDAPMTNAELEAAVSRLSGLIAFADEQSGRAPSGLRARLSTWLNDPERVSDARRRLGDAGAARDLVQTLPDMQALLLDEKRQYAVAFDERRKLLVVPLARHAWWPGPEAEAREGDGLFAALLPPIAALRRAQGELEQELALIRHVEALRLHAATSGGTLPAAISDIALPLPDDPFTGQPFDYWCQDTTAHLRGRALRDAQDRAGSRIHYEVRLQK